MNEMGFFDSLGEGLGLLTKGALESVVEQRDRILRYKKEYSRYDDEYLFRKFKDLRVSKRDLDLQRAIMMILKERGYGNLN